MGKLPTTMVEVMKHHEYRRVVVNGKQHIEDTCTREEIRSWCVTTPEKLARLQAKFRRDEAMRRVADTHDGWAEEWEASHGVRR